MNQPTSGAAAAPQVSPNQVITKPKRVPVPTINQMSEVECSAASLAMVLAHYGKWVPLSDLRESLGISRDGATALDIIKGAEKYGLKASGTIGGFDKLQGVQVPAIIWVRRSHFVVLEGAHDGKFYINDPGSGRYKFDAQQMQQQYSDAVLWFSPGPNFKKTGHPFRVIPALGAWLRNSLRGTVFAITVGLLVMLLGLALPPLSELIVNDYFTANDDTVVPTVVTALMAIGLFRGGLAITQYGVLTRLQVKFSLVGSARFLDHLLRMPILFYMQRAAGDLSQRVSYNVGVAQLLATQLASAGIAIIGLLGFITLLFYYQWVIALVVVFLSLINVVILQVVLSRRRSAQSLVTHSANSLRGTTVSAVRSIETIKSTGTEDDIFTSLSGQQSHYISAETRLVNATAVIGSAPTTLFSLSSATILIFGGALVIAGDFSFGALLAMQTIAININSPIQTLMATGSQLQVITASLESLDDVLKVSEDPQLTEAGSADPQEPAGHLELKNVTFGYSTTRAPVIENFSLELKPGARVALVGVSGAGKSTIGDLAAGLLRPWGGEILVDGTPITDYRQGALAGVMAKVDQDIITFEGTVRQNVTLWDDAIPDSHVIDALDAAQILPDVLARSGGIETRVSATKPRIMILDEATSALDTTSEANVDAALRSRGLTCLIIAHRLSTIRDSDEIVVLGLGGVVKERGTHQELLKQQGEYYRLVAQAGDGGNVGT
jgi:NHLM bacteriocin system ABC transporter peptidase/ATP-binding protein